MSNETTGAALGASNSSELLGPLPAYGINTASHAGFRVKGYTADQMREYAAQQVKAERERWMQALRDSEGASSGMCAPWEVCSAAGAEWA